MENTNPKKKLLNLFLFLLVITLFSVSPIIADSYFQQGENVSLTLSCSKINCSESPINITILYPNSSIAIDNQETTVQNGYINFTIPDSVTQTLGTYFYYVNNYGAFIFTINPSGEEPTETTSFLYLGLLLVLIILELFVFWAHMGDKGFVWQFWWFSVTWILMICITYISWQIADNFLISARFLASIFYILFMLLILSFPFYLLILILVTFTIIFIWIWKILPLKERGMTTEESWDHLKIRYKGTMMGKWLNLINAG